MSDIELTEKAIAKIKEIANSENLEPRIRAGIKGGGCSGYQHDLFFESKKDIRDTDNVFQFDGVEVVVDMMSMTYLVGTTIDYTDGLMGTGFKFINPAAKRTCGCGSSFSM